MGIISAMRKKREQDWLTSVVRFLSYSEISVFSLFLASAVLF